MAVAACPHRGSGALPLTRGLVHFHCEPIHNMQERAITRRSVDYSNNLLTFHVENVHVVVTRPLVVAANEHLRERRGSFEESSLPGSQAPTMQLCSTVAE